MKKILLASAATMMVAGPVAAQGIDLSGYARFGFQFVEGADGGFNDGEVTTNSRFRLNMSASAETDFGATVYVFQRAQTSGNVGGPTTNFAAPRFGVRGGGLDVRLGNIVGAIEDMPGHYFGSRSAGLGLAGLGFQNMAGNVSGQAFVWDAFSSADQGPAAHNGIEAVYTVAGIRAHLSYTDGDRVTGLGGSSIFTPFSELEYRERLAGTLAYTFGEFNGAIGFQEVNSGAGTYAKMDNQKVIATLGVNFDQFRVNVQASDNRGVKKAVLAGAFDATPEATLYAFVGHERGNRDQVRLGRTVNDTDFNGTSGGIGVSYALGGGASIESAVVRSSNSVVAADFGMFFSF